MTMNIGGRMSSSPLSDHMYFRGCTSHVTSQTRDNNMISSSGGFCYSDASSSGGNPTHVVNNQIQGFVSDSEMFNLTAGMDMIGFSRNLHQHSDWKSTSFLAKPDAHHPGPSSSINFYHHDLNKKDFTSGISGQNLLVGGVHDWQHNRLLVDDSASLRCAFPCEPNERPTQGLSLSLSSTNPSGIGLQYFQLRSNNKHRQQEDFVSSSSREALFGKSPHTEHGYLGKPANFYQEHFHLKNSKYLLPAQQLLNEFCSLEMKQSDTVKQKPHRSKQFEEDNSTGPSKKHPVTSLEFVELQKRKTKLLSMLEEVDKRYRHYCNQMKAVVSSFEAVAGNGAATGYSSLALKAMSRHFKCLKDGIMDQLESTRKAMGEKDGVAVGATRGETPRLRVVDQAMRQQRAFQQMGMMECHPWRPQRGLPERSVTLLRSWLFEHFLNPYPSDADKHILARQTGLSRSQVSNWFINARVRLWKPMVEEMYLKEVNEQEGNIAPSDDASGSSSRNAENPPQTAEGVASECVSTTLSTTNNQKNSDDQCLGMGTTSFGSGEELDFSAYTTSQSHSGGMACFNNENYRGEGYGVCLKLGLEQEDSGSQIHEYSVLEGQTQSLPTYTTHFMASDLLHHLAG